jgi:hypothetical protein
MRNNNTFGIKYPTGSIGRYGTEDTDNAHNAEVLKNSTQNHKTKNTKA